MQDMLLYKDAFGIVLSAFTFSSLRVAGNGMVQNWQAYLVNDSSVPAGKYTVVFEWDHHHDKAVLVDNQGGLGRAFKPTDDPRCSGTSTVTSPVDGQPFWMPRFNSRPVPESIKQVTGIQFASIDWQPCGHKDVVICHAESHYDIHFYYVPESELNSLPMCTIGSSSNPNLPVCRDTSNPINHAYFKLVNENIPQAYFKTDDNAGNFVSHNVDFCVDPSSAIVRSGVHYGDKTETLGEWKSPVTIVGSHDCTLMFFEPMISWKWISHNVFSSVWPRFGVKDIQYSNKSFRPLPDAWDVEVSAGCQSSGVFATTTNGACHIKLTVTGDSCAAGNGTGPCTLTRSCDNQETIKDCTTGQLYQSPPGAGHGTTTMQSSTTNTSTATNTSTTTIILTEFAPPLQNQTTGSVSSKGNATTAMESSTTSTSTATNTSTIRATSTKLDPPSQNQTTESMSSKGNATTRKESSATSTATSTSTSTTTTTATKFDPVSMTSNSMRPISWSAFSVARILPTFFVAGMCLCFLT